MAWTGRSESRRAKRANSSSLVLPAKVSAASCASASLSSAVSPSISSPASRAASAASSSEKIDLGQLLRLLGGRVGGSDAFGLDTGTPGPRSLLPGGEGLFGCRKRIGRRFSQFGHFGLRPGRRNVQRIFGRRAGMLLGSLEKRIYGSHLNHF